MCGQSRSRFSICLFVADKVKRKMRKVVKNMHIERRKIIMLKDEIMK